MMTNLQLQLARERHEREIREAARRRLVARPSTTLRQTIGRSIIRIGERMAAEPSMKLARPR